MKSKILNYFGPLCLGAIPFIVLASSFNINYNQIALTNGHAYALGYIVGEFLPVAICALVIFTWIISSISHISENKALF